MKGHILGVLVWWVAVSGAVRADTFPLEQASDGRLYVRAEVAGVGEARVLLALAERSSLLYRSYFKAHEISPIPRESTHILAPGGRKITDVFPFSTMDILGITLRRRHMPGWRQPMSNPADGVIGFQPFLGRYVHLDPKGGSIRLLGYFAPEAPDAWTVLDGRPIVGGVLGLPAEVGGVAMTVMVGTGSPQSVLNPAAADALASARRPWKNKGRLATAHGTLEVDLLRFEGGVQFDGYAWPVRALLTGKAPQMVHRGLEAHPTLLLGMDFLKSREVIVDLRGWRLMIRKS